MNLYQTVLKQLAELPEASLTEVHEFLNHLSYREGTEGEKFTDQKEAILSFSGSWGDMTESDFQEMIQRGKASATELFDREIDL